MTIEEIVKIILEKNYLFKISIPGTQFSQGITSMAQAMVDSTDLLNYFQRIVSANRAKNLYVRLYTPNGSSYKLRGEHLIFLPGTETVATPSTTATNTATNVEQRNDNTLRGPDQPPHQKNSNEMLSVKDQIDYGVLQVKHQMLQGVADKLETEVKELRKKVETLHDEKLALVKENTVAGEKNAFEIEKAKFEVLKESKDGLSGAVDFAEKNPELVKMLLAGLFPNNPAFKEGGNGTMEGTKQIEAPKLHVDPQVNDLLVDMPNQIKMLDPKQISKIYMVFMKFKEAPETIETAFKTILPEHAE